MSKERQQNPNPPSSRPQKSPEELKQMGIEAYKRLAAKREPIPWHQQHPEFRDPAKEPKAEASPKE